MKNSIIKYILIIILLIIIIGAIIYFYTSNNNSSNNTTSSQEGSRTSTAVNTENTKNETTNTTVPKETQIGTYSTIIKDTTPGRLTNIRITCDIINGHIVNPGENFSFNNVVGKPTAERGYQEAKIIIDHKTETGIGGGNCQVSSTLYNAVLSIPSLAIIERHEHGKDVTYVPKGKDAAVSYGSLDFKFKNNNNYKVRINLISDDKNITASLVKVED